MPLLRLAFVLGSLAAVTGMSGAATPKEIDDAIQKGAASLKQHYANATPAEVAAGEDGIGPAALSGLALLESGVAADDAAVKAITAGVRDAAFTEVRTYQVTLCILFLDRLGDPADEPIIQMLAVRLLAGQNARGGWTYPCTDPVSAADLARLRGSLMDVELKADGKNPQPPAGKAGGKAATPAKPLVAGKLHPEIQKYSAKLAAQRRPVMDDNSNTQFGILGVWVARRHGVNVEAALDRIEKRFLATQMAGGGWPYNDVMPGSPSMTCAGLLGLATAVARREEREMKATRKPEPKATPPAKPAAKSDDPFFNPPPKPAADEPPAKNPPPKAGRKRPADAREAAIRKAFASLAGVLGGNAGRGRGNGLLAGGTLGDRDYYFLWSLERVGVIFEVEKIGNADWYALGADALVAAQYATGGWGKPPNGTMVETAFALLFLSKSNLVRDLSAKIGKSGADAELRAGTFPADPAAAVPKAPTPKAPPARVVPTVISPAGPATGRVPPTEVTPVTPRPGPPTNPAPELPAPDVKTLVAELTAASGAEWDKTLARVRDARGDNNYTRALATAAGKLDGEKRKAVREALAERLARMSAETLRTLARDEDAELRRGALLAMGMKDDKSHVLDLILSLNDGQDEVVRAARAGLKSLTGEDFGPAPNATAGERADTIRAWSAWLKRQKK